MENLQSAICKIRRTARLLFCNKRTSRLPEGQISGTMAVPVGRKESS
jgi:hypothetical protein